jgi:hypothetical protein
MLTPLRIVGSVVADVTVFLLLGVLTGFPAGELNGRSGLGPKLGLSMEMR